MSIVSDILARMDALASQRGQWERVWSDIADYCLPDHARFTPGSAAGQPYDLMAQAPSSIERARNRFDDTALRAVDRLASPPAWRAW